MGKKPSPAVLYRVPRQHYPMAVSARGMYITDADGKRYLDMSGGSEANETALKIAWQYWAARGYLKRIREICDRHNILLIADEIICRGERTGTYFAHERDDMKPDIMALAKGIRGGYQPLAAAIAGPKVATVLTTSGFAHGHTYIGHASACAAGVAVQKAIDQGLIVYQGRIRVDDWMVPHIMLAPPMIAEDRHRLECIDKLTAAIEMAL